MYICLSVETMMYPRNENVLAEHITVEIFCHVVRKNYCQGQKLL